MAFLIASSVLVALILFTLFIVKMTFSQKKVSHQEEKELLNQYSLNIIKKYSNYKISHQKGLYFFTGLLIALVFTTLVIEYKTELITQHIFEGEEIVYVEDGIYIPIMQQTPPPPLPPKQTTPPVIKEVSDDMLLEKPTIDFTDEEPRVYSEPIPEIAYTEIPEATDNIFHGFELGKQPAYPGGTPKFLADIANNFMLSERDYNEKGRIFVQFVIEKDGTISNIEIVKSMNARLDNEAIRVLKSLAKWSPGLNDMGQAVRVRYAVPIQIQ